jgi:hypothetical protein
MENDEMARKKTSLKSPGEIADESGQYEIVGPRGGYAGGMERTVTKGEPFPPTPKPGQKYRFVDKTKTRGRKSNRKK